jgi:dolichol-phosphate mannosyltransferase
LRGLLSFYAVCAIGAVANVGVAEAVYVVVPQPELASATGAVVGALWNFLASSAFTWKAR